MGRYKPENAHEEVHHLTGFKRSCDSIFVNVGLIFSIIAITLGLIGHIIANAHDNCSKYSTTWDSTDSEEEESDNNSKYNNCRDTGTWSTMMTVFGYGLGGGMFLMVIGWWIFIKYISLMIDKKTNMIYIVDTDLLACCTILKTKKLVGPVSNISHASKIDTIKTIVEADSGHSRDVERSYVYIHFFDVKKYPTYQLEVQPYTKHNEARETVMLMNQVFDRLKLENKSNNTGNVGVVVPVSGATGATGAQGVAQV